MDKIAQFHKVLTQSKKIIVVSGAGLSAPSGIGTFRGHNGRWGVYDPRELATPEAFAENPTLVWQFYHYRREEVRGKLPNAAHKALARFSIPSIRNKIAPGSQFVHITQNVDGLCQTAIAEVESELGEKADGELIEMHGRLFGVKCTAHDCDYSGIDMNPAITSVVSTGDLKVDAAKLRIEDLPRCPECGQMTRPDVVWFGETPKQMEETFKLAMEADLCLVIGTSALVQPAASLGDMTSENGGIVAVFNVEETHGEDEANFMILGGCEETVVSALGV